MKSAWPIILGWNTACLLIIGWIHGVRWYEKYQNHKAWLMLVEQETRKPVKLNSNVGIRIDTNGNGSVIDDVRGININPSKMTITAARGE